MKKTCMFLMALGLVAVLTACGGSSDGATDENQTTTTTPATNCQAKVTFADSEGVQVEATCTNAGNIDLDGSAGNPTPYIQINELQVQLTADEIISNDGNTVVWHKIVYPLPSSLNVMAHIVVYASNEAGDFVKVVSPEFSVQTAAAPKPAPATPDPEPSLEPSPDPEPTNTAPTGQDLTINAAGAGTISGDIVISDAEDAISALTVTVVTPPAHGTIVWNTKTNFTYTVTAGSGYNGDDSFTYNVTDSQGLTSSPNNNVTITAVLDL